MDKGEEGISCGVTPGEKQGPPFGGSSGEYKSVFEPCFDIKTMDECYNSIPPGTASEVFIILVKKP